MCMLLTMVFTIARGYSMLLLLSVCAIIGAALSNSSQKALGSNLDYSKLPHLDPLDDSITWDCRRSWPDHAMYLTLYVPSRDLLSSHKWPSHFLPEYFEIFLRGAMMFYPWEVSKTPLIIMIDAEKKNTTEFQEGVADMIANGQKEFGSAFPKTQIIFNEPITNAYATGHSRMQYLGFYADRYVKEEFILFVDSDAFLHSFLDREDLWDKSGKAIIQGRFNKHNYQLFRERTFEALGQQELFSCMSYFPFVIKREHLPHIREAIRQYHNTSTFEEAYAQFASTSPGAQYNIMCTWLYLNRHDDYAWGIKNYSPGWDGVYEPRPANKSQRGDRSTVKPEDFRFTVPYLSDHCTYALAPVGEDSDSFIPGYQDYQHTRRVLEHLLLTSLCYLETKPPHTFKVAKNASRLSQWVLSRYSSFCPGYLLTHPYHDAWMRFEWDNFAHLLSRDHKMYLKAAREQRIKHFGNNPIM